MYSIRNINSLSGTGEAEQAVNGDFKKTLIRDIFMVIAFGILVGAALVSGILYVVEFLVRK